ncbi:sulfatase-like hydrolase/transferase [bacterium]|nr:sulfatase-like hydrolase/transferase [Armatimonadota bacterium]NCQ34114.1 sulfatase-like hydrolase/transferase [bacterium]OIP07329.1 MAG: sulfatase [Armatimonadetes bacterium CG2_30_66_41]PIU95402.1 MAG: sulfatase [Armatimonadetes bacterium CG06_land_8_20_14_3_00_66_21]PIX43574.1 MAG: sulfatase [Armatimonadetes bacterium CG_4_8_14_3_um_filter_66_20]PIY50377.1 MAG: sulfatase [Armatimonadetes bacterium CG_4_10_14_3_um_filter_66_18]PIZ36589.1 MAG: sulfatase [Armatimonadetes bacterium CG_4_10_
MSTPDRPNILFLLTDDQGPWALGCAGNPEIRTPNLDRLAASGTRFENFFVATPVCSPSRATLLTGRIPSQHGVHDWLKGGNTGPDAIRYLEGEVAYTDLLARNGWTCGLSGKWHLGDSQIPQHGFIDWFSHQFGGGRYNDAPMVRNGQLVDEPGYVTDVITDEALRLLDRYADLAVPFYLGVHYTAPHSPWTGHPQGIVDSYDDCPFESCPQEPIHPWAKAEGLTTSCMNNREMLKGYFAAVTAMDANVGRLLDRLETLGIRDNTLVVFVSDNGFSCGHHGFWGKGNGTLPRNMYENSIKVPFIASHPAVIPAGRVTDAMVSAYDFMPTLLDYVGLSVPTRSNSPGCSFLPILRGEPAEGREDVVLFDEYGPVRMIRTAHWKYVHRHAHGPHELFDLVNDPGERLNLAADPDRAELIQQLRGRIDEWFAQYVEGRRDGLLQNGMVHGQERFVDR